MSPIHCPICEREFTPGDAMPFCSIRCKLIDCARWLDEAYELPVEEHSTDFEDEQRTSGQPVSGEFPES